MFAIKATKERKQRPKNKPESLVKTYLMEKIGGLTINTGDKQQNKLNPVGSQMGMPFPVPELNFMKE